MTIGRNLTTTDLNTSIAKGEPRISSGRLADRLGYDRPDYVNRMITRHMAELESYGEVSRQFDGKPGVGSAGGRPSAEYHLNEAQTLLVCMFSRTPAAAQVRREVIDVYMAYRRGNLKPPALVTEEAFGDKLYEMLEYVNDGHAALSARIDQLQRENAGLKKGLHTLSDSVRVVAANSYYDRWCIAPRGSRRKGG